MGDETTDAPAEVPTKDSKGREFVTRAMIAEHSGREDVWMSIHNKVYNVTKYLEDHPGGEEVLMDRAGQDATEDFEDVGHSNEARKKLEEFNVGELPPSEKKTAAEATGGGAGGSGMIVAVVVALLAVGGGYYYMNFMQ